MQTERCRVCFIALSPVKLAIEYSGVILHSRKKSLITKYAGKLENMSLLWTNRYFMAGQNHGDRLNLGNLRVIDEHKKIACDSSSVQVLSLEFMFYP